MKKRLWISSIAVFLVLSGAASQVEASEDPVLQEIRIFNSLVEASLKGDASAAKDIGRLLAGHPVPMREIKKGLARGLNKFAWKISKPGESGQWWWIIYEHKNQNGTPIASAYLLKADNPPTDATIL